jgi:hypothetical protein
LGLTSHPWGALRPSSVHPADRILGPVFIRYYLELELPFDEVEQALLTDPGSWLPGMATEAGDQGERLLVDVGFEVVSDRRVDREVQIEIGEPVSVRPETTMLPIAWKAKHGVGPVPQLDADIEIATLGPTRTQLSMSARYRPPLGMIGRALDKALMHRVAEATVKDFLDRVGERLALRSDAHR